MKNYTITVNGNVYDVTVEETGSTPSTASTPRRAAAPAAAAPKAAAPAGAGSIKVEAGAAGKVFKLEMFPARKSLRQPKRRELKLAITCRRLEKTKSGR